MPSCRARLLLDEHDAVAFGVGDAGDGGAAGNIEGCTQDGAAERWYAIEGFGKVSHLDVEDDAGAFAREDVAGDRFGRADAGLDWAESPTFQLKSWL